MNRNYSCNACGAVWGRIPPRCPECGGQVQAQVWVGPVSPIAEARTRAHAILARGVLAFTDDPAVLAEHLNRGRVRLGGGRPDDLHGLVDQLAAAGLPYDIEVATRPGVAVAQTPNRAPAKEPWVHRRAVVGATVALAVLGGGWWLVEQLLSGLQDVLRPSMPAASGGTFSPTPPAVRSFPIGPVVLLSGTPPIEGMGVVVGDPPVVVTLETIIPALRIGQQVWAADLQTNRRVLLEPRALDDRTGLLTFTCATPGCQLLPMAMTPLSQSARGASQLSSYVVGQNQIQPRPDRGVHAAWVYRDTVIFQTALEVTSKTRGAPVFTPENHVVGLLTDRAPPANEGGYFVAIEHALAGSTYLVQEKRPLEERLRYEQVQQWMSGLPQLDVDSSSGQSVVARRGRRMVSVLGAHQSHHGFYLKLRVTVPLGEPIPADGWRLSRQGHDTIGLGVFERVLERSEVSTGHTIYVLQYTGPEIKAEARGCQLTRGDLSTPFFRISPAPPDTASRIDERFGPKPRRRTFY